MGKRSSNLKPEPRNIKKPLLAIGSGLVVVLVIYFFASEFIKNWSHLANENIELSILPLLLAVVVLIVSYLFVTVAWVSSINKYAVKQFTIAEGLALYNTTQLTKYIPGKVWSYAIQMVLLSRKNVPASITLYVNLMITAYMLLYASIIGVSALIIYDSTYPIFLKLTIILLAILLIVFTSIFGAKLYNSLLALINKIFKKNIVQYQFETKILLRLQLLGLASVICSGFSAYLAAVGIGMENRLELVLPVISGAVLADTIGFLALFAPGGIGVREGVFYLLLNGKISKLLSLTVPIAFRVVSIVVDAILGIIGLTLLRKFMKQQKDETNLDSQQSNRTDYP